MGVLKEVREAGPLKELAVRLDLGPRGDPLPVLPALRPIVPGGGLRPGSVVQVEGPGAVSLGLALLAGVSRQGDAWTAAVGLADLGVVAAAGMGVDPQRLLVVRTPGSRWPDVVAALAETARVILLRPDGRPGPAVLRRLTALTRRHGCVLVSTGPWEGARLTLRVETAEWAGLGGGGHGHLRGRRAHVVAASPGRSPDHGGWILLPGPDGAVASLTEPEGVRRTALEGVA